MLDQRYTKHPSRVRNVIKDKKLHLIVLTETLYAGDMPRVITEDIAPPGFSTYIRLDKLVVGGDLTGL